MSLIWFDITTIAFRQTESHDKKILHFAVAIYCNIQTSTVNTLLWYMLEKYFRVI